MSLLGKKFPAPIARPLFPFYAAGLVILYGINSGATAMMKGMDEYKNDPRNPYTRESAGH